jgi:membrane protein required for colicin V production
MDITGVTNAVLIGVIAMGTITGLVKGLVRQVLELAGVVASFLLAVFFSGWAATMLERHFELPYSPALVVGFLLLFIGGTVLFHFIAQGVQRVVHMTFLGWVDRFCGGALGLVIGLLVASLLVAAALELPIPAARRNQIEQADVSLFVRPIAPWLFNAIFSHGPRGIEYRDIFRRGGTI